MDIPNKLQCGDLIFTSSNADISKIIKKFTFSKVNHVLLALSKQHTIETDWEYREAIFSPTTNLNGKKLTIIRPRFYTANSPGMIQTLAELYRGTPYSLWDVAMNGLFCWLKDEIRARWLSFLSTKRFMKCDELAARIVYETTGHESLKYWEGMSPGRLLEICLSRRHDYEIIYSNI